MPPHNMPFVLVGAALLWFGWVGFNAGSALAAKPLDRRGFVAHNNETPGTGLFSAPNTAPAASALSRIGAEWLGKGKPTVLGAASVAVAGLVAITPASGF